MIDIYDASNVRLFGVDVDYPCPVFLVDLNSGNLPNQIGRDVFAFLITKKGLQPAGQGVFLATGQGKAFRIPQTRHDLPDLG